jgi:uncharacterized DUF497 family protein
VVDGFEWDEAKASSNLEKHGVGFAEAASALLDPLALTVFDTAHSVTEDRWLTIGYSQALRLLLVISTDRDSATRIISARKATSGERQIYEQHNR